MKSKILIIPMMACALGHATPPNPYADLETVFKNRQWDETAEMAYEIALRQPRAALPRLRGAYALFERGYSSAALRFLKDLSPEDWKSLPRDQDRFAEIVALFQKKVPIDALPGRLDRLDEGKVSGYLRDEIRFARGREAFEKRDVPTAKSYLSAVSKTSRYYADAHYLLGTLAILASDWAGGSAEFSKIFEPAVFEQAPEFWKDVSAQMTSHWGAALKVAFDSEAIEKANRLGQLAMLALARISYATKDYESALARYAKVSDPRYQGRATLETVWTLLRLDRNDRAEEAAAKLSVENEYFEAIEARPLRALVLTDSGRTDEARRELDRFFSAHDDAKSQLTKAKTYRETGKFPGFLKLDIEEDVRLRTLAEYEAKLATEIAALRNQDARLFPVYSSLSNELESARVKAKNRLAEMIDKHITRRFADLDKLYLQAKLIRAETYLEDRERLRDEFRKGGAVSESKQREHDARLVGLLDRAVGEVDDAMAATKAKGGSIPLALQFRQAELLWELATARLFVAQASDGVSGDDKKSAADGLKVRALGVAEMLWKKYPNSPKAPETLFFLGFAQLELGKTREAYANFELYTKRYPKHVHGPDAYRILADKEFDANRFGPAEAFYRKILEFPETPVAGYALYKIGWCGYNLHSQSRALLAFEKAIGWSAESDGSGQSLSLKREARHDLISVYAEVGDHRKATEYFRRFAGAEALAWTTDLAKQLETTGQFERANDLYTELIRTSPAAPENYAYQGAILKGHYRLHRWDHVLTAARELADRYASQSRDPKTEGPSFIVEGTFREAVEAQHYEVSKIDSNRADVDRVLETDKLYLQLFREWPQAAEPAYGYAQFLMRHGRVKEAVVAYADHWRDYKKVLKEPLREEALRSLLHAQEVYEEKQQGDAKLTAEARATLDSSAEYAKEYPRSPYRRSIEYFRSALLFKYGQTGAGIVEAQRLFDENPADSVGKRSFTNLRVAYYAGRDWPATAKWAEELGDRRELGAYRGDLDSIREEARFLAAQEEKDDTRAAEMFQKLADDPRAKRLKDKSRYNAFVKLQKLGRGAEALALSETLEKAAPGFDGLSGIAGERAALYQEAGDYRRALPLLETFLRKPGADVAPETIRQATLSTALIAEAVGQGEPAARGFKAYLAGAQDLKSAGPAEAQNGLRRMGVTTGRAVASMPSTLAKRSAEFMRQPLPKIKDIGVCIETGGENLQSLSKQYSAIAANPETSPAQAFEAYCALPSLYRAYSAAVAKATKIAKMVEPLDAKAKELAGECLKRATEAYHSGPNYLAVVRGWGWGADPKAREEAAALGGKLGAGARVDATKLAASEAEILEMHLKKLGNQESWYALAVRRFERGDSGLARLTLVDAIGKPGGEADGRIYNLLAQIPERGRESRDVVALFEKAIANGSRAAYAGLAAFHLKEGRLDDARVAIAREEKSR